MELGKRKEECLSADGLSRYLFHHFLSRWILSADTHDQSEYRSEIGDI